VDLGLIYDVEVKRDAINVRMSLTTPGCPSSQEISQDVRAKLEEAGFPSPKVELVWDPPWSAHRISEYGKKQLGL
jgi:metal-sulfur cluster biosynthetic enzyme